MRSGSRREPHGRRTTNIAKRKAISDVSVTRGRDRHLRAIVYAIKLGSGIADPEINVYLERAIKKALKENVPRSTIDTRIKKFVSEGEQVFQMNIQGTGPGGAAIMVDCVGTNEKAVREIVTKAFNKCGGQVGRDNCVDFMFQKQGVLHFDGISEDKVMEAAMDAEVEDCRVLDDGVVEIVTLPENLHASTSSFEERGIQPSSAQVEIVPLSETELSPGDAYDTLRLLFFLEELGDVQAVHTNAMIPDDTELVNGENGRPQSWDWVQKRTGARPSS